MAGIQHLWAGPIRLADAGERPTIEGVAIPYLPAVAQTPGGGLACEPGCVKFDDFVQGNLQHDRRLALARKDANLHFEDSAEALTFKMALLTETTNGRDALALIRAGVITGASAEFYTLAARVDQRGVRVQKKILLTGLALCDQPAYPTARIREALAAAQGVKRRPRPRIW